MILRSSDERVEVGERRPFRDSPMAWHDLAGASPIEWLAAARRCPELARVLLLATLDGFTVDEFALAEWPRQFIAHPRWPAIANRLRSSPPVEHAQDSRYRLAQVAASIATQTRWSPLESAYWIALVGNRDDDESLQPYPWTRPLSALPGHLRCRQLAAWIIASEELRGNRRDREGTVAIERERLLRVLEHASPGVSWPAIFEETRTVLDLDAVPLNRQDGRLLAHFADLAAVREELALRELSIELYRAADPESFLQSAASLMTRCTSSPLAIWLRHHLGEGVGIVVDNTFGVPGAPTIVRGSLAAFEVALPGFLRASMEIRAADGRSAGKLFISSDAVRPVEPLTWIADAFPRVQHTERDVEFASLAAWNDRIREFDDKFRQAIAEFSAGAGHEINNPLGAILGQAQWLQHDETDPKRRHSLQKITEQVARIRRMIRDLRLIGRPVGPKKVPVTIAPIVAAAIANASKRAGGATLNFWDGGIDAQVLGDADELKRMFEEVFVNGLQAAGPEGQVTVRVFAPSLPTGTARQRGRTNAGIVVETVDSGPGFTPEDLRLGLTPFYSGRSAGRGLGMGLPVADRIAADHGGEINIERGGATTVRILLPIFASRE